MSAVRFSVQSGALDDGDVVAGELVETEGLADLHLHQLQLKAGETVEIVGLTDEKRTTVVTSMEMFHKLSTASISSLMQAYSGAEASVLSLTRAFRAEPCASLCPR